MPLRASATLIFHEYTVEDGGIRLTFRCADPGAGEPSFYTIFLTDAELAGVSNQAQLRTLVQTKLDRKLRATGIASKLDQFLGSSLTV